MHYTTHLLRHMRATIGQNIRHHRTQQKMPLHKLSRLTGIPERLLDHYELGKNEIRLDEMLKIACVLQIETQGLMI
ncbi:helix-turn-helix domain-containing protein [bacterium]|nr:helix-turn-helix domain-containing protein [bacterium]